MNKLYYFLAAFGLFQICSFAQLGIGSDSNLGMVHIDSKENNDTEPDVTKNLDDILITTDGKIGVGNLNPITKLDMRNETNENIIGIGTTTQTAANAGAGAIQYFDNGTDSGLYYSNGSNWIPVNSKATNSLVYATKGTSQSIPTNTATTINNWNPITDEGDNFDETTGVFTAPRTGVYVVSLNLATESGSIANNSKIEIIISSNSTNGVPEYRCLNSYPGYSTGTATNIASGSCTGIFYLNEGQTITPRFHQNISTGSRNLSNNEAYNVLTIYGL